MASVTQTQIAEALNISRATVSQVLSGFPKARISAEVREQVLETARRLKYSPNQSARRLRAGRTKLIGTISFRGGGYLSANKSLAVVRTLTREGWEPLAIDSYWFKEIGGDEGMLSCQRMLDARVEGVVLVDPSTLFTQEYLESLTRAGIPVVSLAGNHLHGIPVFESDRQWGYKTLAQHLLGLGHRRLALFSGSHPPMEHGVAEAMSEHTAHSNERLPAPAIVKLDHYASAVPPARPAFNYETGHLAMRDLLRQSPRPDAVLCSNDEVALGALTACEEAGVKVPRDIAITGFDDLLPGAYGTVPLTTIAFPHTEMAGQAVARLLQMIRKKEEPASQLTRIRGTLITRRSCGASPTES